MDLDCGELNEKVYDLSHFAKNSLSFSNNDIMINQETVEFLLCLSKKIPTGSIK